MKIMSFHLYHDKDKEQQKNKLKILNSRAQRIVR